MLTPILYATFTMLDTMLSTQTWVLYQVRILNNIVLSYAIFLEANIGV